MIANVAKNLDVPSLLAGSAGLAIEVAKVIQDRGQALVAEVLNGGPQHTFMLIGGSLNDVSQQQIEKTRTLYGLSLLHGPTHFRKRRAHKRQPGT